MYNAKCHFERVHDPIDIMYSLKHGIAENKKKNERIKIYVFWKRIILCTKWFYCISSVKILQSVWIVVSLNLLCYSGFQWFCIVFYTSMRYCRYNMFIRFVVKKVYRVEVRSFSLEILYYTAWHSCCIPLKEYDIFLKLFFTR